MAARLPLDQRLLHRLPLRAGIQILGFYPRLTGRRQQARPRMSHAYPPQFPPTRLDLAGAGTGCVALAGIPVAITSAWAHLALLRLDTPRATARRILGSPTRLTPRLPEGPARPALCSLRRCGPDAGLFHSPPGIDANGPISLSRPSRHSQSTSGWCRQAARRQLASQRMLL